MLNVVKYIDDPETVEEEKEEEAPADAGTDTPSE